MLRALCYLLADHALRKEVLERLVNLMQAEVAQSLREKPRVKKVHDRVLYTAYVLVDRHPVASFVFAEGQGFVPGRSVSQEVPGRIDESVHGVCLAPGLIAALGADGVDEIIGPGKRREPLAGEVYILRQYDRKLGIGNRHCAAFVAIDDRYGATPVPLP